jgi:hypothetical protein
MSLLPAGVELSHRPMVPCSSWAYAFVVIQVALLPRAKLHAGTAGAMWLDEKLEAR